MTVTGGELGAGIENITPVRSTRVDGPGTGRRSKLSMKRAETMSMPAPFEPPGTNPPPSMTMLGYARARLCTGSVMHGLGYARARLCTGSVVHGLRTRSDQLRLALWWPRDLSLLGGRCEVHVVVAHL